MNSISMAVFDLDGTLLEHGALTGAAADMLRALRRSGVLTVIATGRHRGTVPLRLQSPRLVDYLICSNGAVILSSTGSVLLEKTISAAELRDLMALGRSFGCRYAVSAGRSTFLSRAEPLLRRKTDGGSDTKKYFWRYYMYPLRARPVASWSAYLSRRDALAEKVVCTPADPGAETAFRAAVEADGRFTATGSNQAAEITSKGVSKGSALSYLAQRLGVSKGAIAAFGNDDNDLSLRDEARCFIVPRDSSPSALREADDIVENIPEAALRFCLPADRVQEEKSL